MSAAREWLNGWLNNSLTQAVRRLVGRERTSSAGEHTPSRELGTLLAGNLSSATLQGIPHRSLVSTVDAHRHRGAAESYPNDPHQQPHTLLELRYSGYWREGGYRCLTCDRDIDGSDPCRELEHFVLERYVQTVVQ